MHKHLQIVFRQQKCGNISFNLFRTHFFVISHGKYCLYCFRFLNTNIGWLKPMLRLDATAETQNCQNTTETDAATVCNVTLKARCDTRFQRAFSACICVFKDNKLIGSNQGSYFENANACSKRTLKTRVTTWLSF